MDGTHQNSVQDHMNIFPSSNSPYLSYNGCMDYVDILYRQKIEFDLEKRRERQP